MFLETRSYNATLEDRTRVVSPCCTNVLEFANIELKANQGNLSVVGRLTIHAGFEIIPETLIFLFTVNRANKPQSARSGYENKNIGEDLNIGRINDIYYAISKQNSGTGRGFSIFALRSAHGPTFDKHFFRNP